MVDPEIILIPLGIAIIFLSIGGAVAITKWANCVFDPRRYQYGQRSRSTLLGLAPEDRTRALETYRQLASEKLGVIKTAIAMGYNEQELKRLDARLEQLIGADAMTGIMRGEAPLASAELVQTDLEAELRALRQNTQS